MVLSGPDQAPGAQRYAVLTNSGARQAAVGLIGRGKQNNFRIDNALSEPLTWGEMLDYLERFLLPTAGNKAGSEKLPPPV